MSAVLKLLLLSAVTLLVSAQEWKNYWSLSDSVRTHIDKALRNANGIFKGPHHVAYHSLLSPLKITADDFYVNVLLMVTTCEKDKQKGFGHRDECVTRKSNMPWFNCLVCKQENGEELIDCVRQKDLKSREHTRSSCPIPSDYRHGSRSIMFQKGGNDEPQVGCPGCV